MSSDVILTANNSGLTMIGFMQQFFGPVPVGFEWVYVFLALFIIVFTLFWFFSILDIRYWFKY